MGNSDSKLQYRKAIIELTTKSQVSTKWIAKEKKTKKDICFFIFCSNCNYSVFFYLNLSLIFQTVDPNNETFWSQFWSEYISSIQDVYTLIPATEIRALREEAPSNLSTLCLKLVEKIKDCSETTFLTEKNSNHGFWIYF